MQRFEKQIYKEQLSAIAFTQGPGLMGSLGSSFAKSIALALKFHYCCKPHASACFSSFY
jgi:N6-L-threonylcarbamoyladenine synthase